MFYLKGNEEDIMKLVKTFEENPPKDFQKHNCNAPLKKDKRGKCKNIFHISEYGLSAEELWEKASEE